MSYWTIGLSIWTLNHIVHKCKWTITSFKIQHSPDFRWKIGWVNAEWCGERMKWSDLIILSFQTLCDWNSWIQVLFYFCLEHRLKTLNKEKCNLTHVVLVIILKIFFWKTLMVWPLLHFPIFLADCKKKKRSNCIQIAFYFSKLLSRTYMF